MKNVLFTLMIFLTGLIRGQDIDLKSIPKGTWKIIIHNSNGQDDNYRIVGQSLISNDYQINTNKEFYTISTVSRSHDRLNFSYILNFVMKDSGVILTGTSRLNTTIDLGGVEINPDNNRIENTGQNGSVAKEAFQELLNAAIAISDADKLEYIR